MAMSECVTHHACDCIQQELDRLRRERDDARNQVEDVIGVEASSWMLRAQALKAELEKVEAERDHNAGVAEAALYRAEEAEAERDGLEASLGAQREAWGNRIDQKDDVIRLLEAERDDLMVSLSIASKGCTDTEADMAHEILELKAERDELREETTVLRQRLSEAGSTVLAIEAERDRYRAALERIAYPAFPELPCGTECTIIAEQALIGGTDD